MNEWKFITLTHIGRHGSGKGRPMHFMLRHIVAWQPPTNNQGGSVVTTVDGGEDGWYVKESPERIIELIREASE